MTYWLANIPEFHFGPVMASSLAGIVGVIITNRFVKKMDPKVVAAVIYCGSFVGMCSVNVVPNILHIGIAGVLSGILFSYAQNIFVGVGGRLGTMAFIGSTVTVLLLTLLGLK